MSEQLNPCPFCGGHAATVVDFPGSAIHVSCKCGAQIWGGKSHFSSPADAAEAWNSRVANPAHQWSRPNCPPPGATHTISGQFYRKAEGSWLVFGHKRDWVPSDAPAGWNDTNLVPLLPELAPARCTCPSGDGSLRWPCPVHRPEETAAASFADGIEAAAKLIERRMNEYVNEHGSFDHDTGYTEFPGNGEETVEEWLNLAEGIRAIKPDAKEPVAKPEPTLWMVRIPDEPEDPENSPAEYEYANSESQRDGLLKLKGAEVVQVYCNYPVAQAPVVLPAPVGWKTGKVLWECHVYAVHHLHGLRAHQPDVQLETLISLDEFKRLNPGIES